MNKKQLIVAWVVTASISTTLMFYPKKFSRTIADGYQLFLDSPTRGALPVTQWSCVLPICLSILIIGSLLIYTLRDKKK